MKIKHTIKLRLLIIGVLANFLPQLAQDVYATAIYDAWARVNIDIMSYQDLSGFGSSTTTLPDGLLISMGSDSPTEVADSTGGGTASASGGWVTPGSGFDYAYEATISGSADYPPDSTAHSFFDTAGLDAGKLIFTNNSDVPWAVEFGFQFQGVYSGSIDDPADPVIDESSSVAWFYSFSSSNIGTIDALTLSGNTSTLPSFEGPDYPFDGVGGGSIYIAPGEIGWLLADITLLGNASSTSLDGNGQTGTGDGGATSIPEPSSAFLLCAGIIALAGIKKKIQVN